jgi:hypothetical protein
MFLPALEEKLKQEKQRQEENRLYLPDLQEQYEEYIKNKQEEKPPERVITIQIM